jgi:hypothetical protein
MVTGQRTWEVCELITVVDDVDDVDDDAPSKLGKTSRCKADLCYFRTSE